VLPICVRRLFLEAPRESGDVIFSSAVLHSSRRITGLYALLVIGTRHDRMIPLRPAPRAERVTFDLPSTVRQ
jgi:hypothetical protein